MAFLIHHNVIYLKKGGRHGRKSTYANSGRVGGADANIGHCATFLSEVFERVTVGCVVLTFVDGLEVMVGLAEMVVLMVVAFFQEKYANKKTCEMILPEDDNKLDFRPHKLRLGTRSENNNDAHTHGCYDGNKNARMKCASYINGVLEKEHESQRTAAKYLMINGHPNSVYNGICQALGGRRKSAYGRTWELC